MDENNQQNQNKTLVVQPQTEKPSHRKSTAILVIISLLIAIFIGAGIYYWQNNKILDLQTKIRELSNAQIQKLTESNNKADGAPAEKEDAMAETFTFSPQTGNMSLTLAKKYAVITSIDGNYGGAPGASFEIGQKIDENNINNGGYSRIKFMIDDTFTTLDEAVIRTERHLDIESNRKREYTVSDTTLGGLPGKLVTAETLNEYDGDTLVYLIGSENWLYKITANGPNIKDYPLLTDTLAGISFKKSDTVGAN